MSSYTLIDFLKKFRSNNVSWGALRLKDGTMENAATLKKNSVSVKIKKMSEKEEENTSSKLATEYLEAEITWTLEWKYKFPYKKQLGAKNQLDNDGGNIRQNPTSFVKEFNGEEKITVFLRLEHAKYYSPDNRRLNIAYAYIMWILATSLVVTSAIGETWLCIAAKHNGPIVFAAIVGATIGALFISRVYYWLTVKAIARMPEGTEGTYKSLRQKIPSSFCQRHVKDRSNSPLIMSIISLLLVGCLLLSETITIFAINKMHQQAFCASRYKLLMGINAGLIIVFVTFIFQYLYKGKQKACIEEDNAWENLIKTPSNKEINDNTNCSFCY